MSDPGFGCHIEAALVAEEWTERVVVGNVDDPGVWEAVDDESFDVVTFGDVLEHLRDPLAVLRAAVRKLKPSGFIVSSLPNVAHGDVRLSLLHGSFQYGETGLLDRTHMRFFTLQTIRELLHDAGLVVVDTRRVVVPLFHTELGVQREEYPEAVVAEIQADKEFETYQFVMKSVIDNGSAAVESMAERLEEATDRVQELEVSNRLLEDRVTGYAEMKAEYERLVEQDHTFADLIEDLTGQVVGLREEMPPRRVKPRISRRPLRPSAAHWKKANGPTPTASGPAPRASAPAAEIERARAAESARQYDEIRNSRSFRMTAPLRRLGALVRGNRTP